MRSQIFLCLAARCSFISETIYQITKRILFVELLVSPTVSLEWSLMRTFSYHLAFPLHSTLQSPLYSSSYLPFPSRFCFKYSLYFIDPSALFIFSRTIIYWTFIIIQEELFSLIYTYSSRGSFHFSAFIFNDVLYIVINSQNINVRND